MVRFTLNESCYDINNKLIDYHCHLLPGIDDGPQTLEESLQMASMLFKGGYGTIFCTPHYIQGKYEADNKSVINTINYLQHELDKEQIPLRLLEGREYYFDEQLLDILADPMPLHGTNYLLIELPVEPLPEFVIEIFSEIVKNGFIPMLAHPERSKIFDNPYITSTHKFKSTFKHRHNKRNNINFNISLYERLYKLHCVFQCDLGSLTGFYGNNTLNNSLNYLDFEIYTHFGTDAHNTDQLSEIISFINKY